MYVLLEKLMIRVKTMILYPLYQMKLMELKKKQNKYSILFLIEICLVFAEDVLK